VTPEEAEAGIARLHVFAPQLAEKLAAASEVLSKIAERKRSSGAPPLKRTLRSEEEMAYDGNAWSPPWIIPSQ
jgi:hypothetical protein